jgi:cytochrome c oxidase subunit III
MLLLATAALGASFLVMHGFEYYREYTEHLVPGIDFRQAGTQARAIERNLTRLTSALGFIWLAMLLALSLLDFLTRAVLPAPW